MKANMQVLATVRESSVIIRLTDELIKQVNDKMVHAGDRKNEPLNNQYPCFV